MKFTAQYIKRSRASNRDFIKVRFNCFVLTFNFEAAGSFSKYSFDPGDYSRYETYLTTKTSTQLRQFFRPLNSSFRLLTRKHTVKTTGQHSVGQYLAHTSGYMGNQYEPETRRLTRVFHPSMFEFVRGDAIFSAALEVQQSKLSVLSLVFVCSMTFLDTCNGLGQTVQRVLKMLALACRGDACRNFETERKKLCSFGADLKSRICFCHFSTPALESTVEN